jgi:hypothetical protein
LSLSDLATGNCDTVGLGNDVIYEAADTMRGASEFSGRLGELSFAFRDVDRLIHLVGGLDDSVDDPADDNGYRGAYADRGPDPARLIAVDVRASEDYLDIVYGADRDAQRSPAAGTPVLPDLLPGVKSVSFLPDILYAVDVATAVSDGGIVSLLLDDGGFIGKVAPRSCLWRSLGDLLAGRRVESAKVQLFQRLRPGASTGAIRNSGRILDVAVPRGTRLP